MDKLQIKNHFEDYYRSVGYNKPDLIKYVKEFDAGGYNESYDGSCIIKQVGNVLIVVSPYTLDFYLVKSI